MSVLFARRYACSDMSLRPRRNQFGSFVKESTALLRPESTKKCLEDLNPKDVEELVDCLVQDLESFPSATDSERKAISKLPDDLKVSTISRLVHHKKGKLCSMHEKLQPSLLDSLDELLLHIAEEPPSPLHLTSSRYFDAFVAMEGVWSEEIEEFSKPTIPGCRLYQTKNCTGCRVRRILSDGLLLDALLVAVGLEPSTLLAAWLIKAWEKLTREVPDQVDHRGEQRMNERGKEVSMLEKDLERMKLVVSSIAKEELAEQDLTEGGLTVEIS